VALTPKTPTEPADKREQQQAAQNEALLREVDDAFRQGQFADFARKYGRPLLSAAVLALAGFGGYLYWDSRRQAEMEAQSEQIVAALDQIDAGNFTTGTRLLDTVAQSGGEGTAAVAKMLKAGVLLQQEKPADAARLFGEVAGDGDAPPELRNLATIRELSLTFDKVAPGEVINRLKPLAVPGNPWFGSAGELVAMAYLAEGKKDQAGTLFAAIAKDEETPASLRSRARQMAGMLGVDAIEDVDKLLEEQNQSAVPSPAAAR